MNKYLIINPEIAAKSLQYNEGDLYLFWLVAKKLDKTGRGIIKLSELLDLCKNIFSLKSNWVYNKISLGIGKYWRAPFGKKGDKSIALIGIGSVIKRLDPDITRAKPMKIPVTLFENSSSKSIREILVSLVASRYDSFHPLSISTISKNTGLSESAVRCALKTSSIVKTRQNFEVVASAKDSNTLLSLVKKDVEKYRIVKNDDFYLLTKQIPNDYFLNDFERLPLCTRPKELKKIDKVLLAKLDPVKYHISKDGVRVNSRPIYSRPVVNK
jgi:hypothetical protein